MSYVIGVDLGTSAVKTVLVDPSGKVVAEHSESYPLSQPKPGYSEQRPEDWVDKTVLSLRELMSRNNIDPSEVEGLSFSGQMHGLVLVDGEGAVLRPAILWNDTRTTAQCRRIEETLQEKLLGIARNRALEGFTLPKILWVQEFEPELLEQAALFLLPKDYVRFRLTGQYAMDYSDAAGTLLLDVAGKSWSTDILDAFQLPHTLCPPLVESFEQCGTCSLRSPSKPLCCQIRRYLLAVRTTPAAPSAQAFSKKDRRCAALVHRAWYSPMRSVARWILKGRSISLIIARKMLTISWA